jgi:hypothetical protein
LLLGHSLVSQYFMEPEGSITNLQELCTCSYPEPDQSSPHHPIPPLHSNIIYPPVRFLPSGLFPDVFPTKNLYAFLLFKIRTTCPHSSHSRIRFLRITHLLHFFSIEFGKIQVPPLGSRKISLITGFHSFRSSNTQLPKSCDLCVLSSATLRPVSTIPALLS